MTAGTEGAIFIWHMPKDVSGAKADSDMPQAAQEWTLRHSQNVEKQEQRQNSRKEDGRTKGMARLIWQTRYRDKVKEMKFWDHVKWSSQGLEPRLSQRLQAIVTTGRAIHPLDTQAVLSGWLTDTFGASRPHKFSFDRSRNISCIYYKLARI